MENREFPDNTRRENDSAHTRQHRQSAFDLVSLALSDQRHAVEAPLREHARDWGEVEQWLEDAESRQSYRQELAFQVLCGLLGAEKATLYSPLSPETWASAVGATRLAQEKKLLPELETGMPPDDAHNLCTLVSGYLLEQYAYSDVVRPRRGDVVFDCGGCFGETAVWCRLEGAGTVYSFEPNPSAFARLQKNARRYDPAAEWFRPLPLALGDKEGSLPFMQRADHPGASAFHPEGNIRVPVTTLDRWCGQHQVALDFIKMDLEGAEPLAILGAERTFRACKPRFAICLYHELSHMWEIPRLLKRYVPEYRLWCKKSSPVGEFVLYGRAD